MASDNLSLKEAMSLIVHNFEPLYIFTPRVVVNNRKVSYKDKQFCIPGCKHAVLS